MDPDFVIRAVGEQHVLLLRVVRKGEVVDSSAHAKCCAAGAATFRTARGSRRVHEETGNKLSLLGKDLNPVAAPLANIDQPVIRNVDAVKRWSKLLLIWRRTRFPVISRRGIVVDLTQGYSVAAPPALECAIIHVAYQNALRAPEVQLVSFFVQIKEKNPVRENVGLLVILDQTSWVLPFLRSRSPMAKVPQKLPIARKLLNAVPTPRG